MRDQPIIVAQYSRMTVVVTTMAYQIEAFTTTLRDEETPLSYGTMRDEEFQNWHDVEVDFFFKILKFQNIKRPRWWLFD